MTVELYSPEVYLGNGSTPDYGFGFKIFASSHLGVFVRDISDADAEDIQLEVDVDFSVPSSSVNDDDGGTISLIDDGQDWLDGDGNLAIDWRLVIKLYVPVKQGTDIKNQGSFYPKVHEDTFDYMTMLIQQAMDSLDRSFKLPESYSSTDFDLTFPVAFVGQANVILMTNETGDGLQVGPSAANVAAADTILAQALQSAVEAALSAQAAADSAAASAGAGVSDTAFGVGWDSGTGTAPSQHATYQAIIGITPTSLGLGNVNNTSDITKNAAAVTLTNKTINGANNTLVGIKRESLVALDEQISTVNSSQTISSTSFAALTNLTVTRTFTGRAVDLKLNAVASATLVSKIRQTGSSGTQAGELRFKRDGTVICTMEIGRPSTVDGSGLNIMPSEIQFTDTGATAGSHTYTVEARLVSATGTTTFIFTNVVLVAIEH